jgi:phosphotransferase system enzyme I (PtsI)
MKGLSIHEGIAIGNAWVIQNEPVEILIEKNHLACKHEKAEMDRFNRCLEEVKAHLSQLKSVTEETLGEDEALIFEAQLCILRDPVFYEKATGRIFNDNCSAERAVLYCKNDITKEFDKISDDLLRERLNDIHDVMDRLIRQLLGIEVGRTPNNQAANVLVTEDLNPSEMITLDESIVGVILEEGSASSHVSIIARAKEIPMLIGVKGACQKIQSDQLLILDGYAGEILLNPDKKVVLDFENKKQARFGVKAKWLEGLKNKATATKDNHPVTLSGNIGVFEEANQLRAYGGKEVGLLRTELFFMSQNHFPTETEQTTFYKSMLHFFSQGVSIRTLDIGGDKSLPYCKMPKEKNPFLGMRGIRHSLKHIDIFKTQLRAILKASAYGNIKIIFPMITTKEEVLESKKILESCMNELAIEGVAFDGEIPIGIMIETPGAVMIADLLAKEVDFFSIGTNDLCQYTYAADRMNPDVSNAYPYYGLSMLRLINKTIEEARRAGIPVSVCGEMSSNPTLALILIGLGVKELSVFPQSILAVKKAIGEYNAREMEELAKKMLVLTEPEDVQRLMRLYQPSC